MKATGTIAWAVAGAAAYAAASHLLMTRAADAPWAVAVLLGRVGTALNYYIDEPAMQKPDREGGRNAQRGDPALAHARASASGDDLRSRVEDMLIERMRNAESLGQRITYYRAFLNVAASDKARGVLKEILRAAPAGGNASVNERASIAKHPDARSLTVAFLPGA